MNFTVATSLNPIFENYSKRKKYLLPEPFVSVKTGSHAI